MCDVAARSAKKWVQCVKDGGGRFSRRSRLSATNSLGGSIKKVALQTGIEKIPGLA